MWIFFSTLNYGYFFFHYGIQTYGLLFFCRPLPHQRFSQLCHQACLLWPSEFGATQPPQEFSSLMAARQSRVEISAQLDRTFDKFKEAAFLHLLKLKPGGLEPVVCPVALNLLPSGGTAEVLAPLSSEIKQFGLIRVRLALQLDLTSKPVDMLALFHLEDVYNGAGRRWVEETPGGVLADLEGCPVDMVARSIAAHESHAGLLGLAAKVAAEFSDVRLPLLQAAVVFMLPRGGGAAHRLVVGQAPLPTFFRRDPTSLNKKQAATAFYFNLTLRCRLDKKVFDFLEICNSQVSSAGQKLLNPCYTNQSLANHYRKNSPRNAVKRLGVLDINSAQVRLNFGILPHALDLTASSAGSLPQTVRDCPARIKLIWLDRPVPKYGLLEFFPPGNPMLSTALFSTSAFAESLLGGNLASRFWCNMPGVRMNAVLANSQHRIPYFVSSIWFGDGGGGPKAAAEAASLLHKLKQEWKKAADQILADGESLNFIVGKAVQAKEEQEMIEQRRQQDLAETSALSGGAEADEAEEAAAAKRAPWRKSFRNKVCVVDRVVNNNYALAVDYQETPGQRDGRFYILFDICDLWVDGQVAQSRGKKMPEVVAEGDRILYNAVHVDVENSWNLNYMATAVVGMKAAGGGWTEMPPDAIFFESSANVKPEKLNIFKVAAAKLTKKPAPEDTRPQRGRGGGRGPRGAFNHRGGRPPHSYQYGRHDSAVTSRGGHRENWADNRKASENQLATTARRNVLISDFPDVYEKLKPMEIYRLGTYIYECKACGIQGMSIEDAEDHVRQSTHIETLESGSVQESRFQVRGDAEEALFLNANKAIKMVERNGKKYYNCEDCKASNMMYVNAKKHAASLAHQRNDRSRKDSSLLDQECKEMRKRLERDGIVYHCTPCFFQTDSIIKNKDHLMTDEHKRLTTLYCHVCKEFSKSKSTLEDHRFSIKHRRNCDELEVACLIRTSPKKQEKFKKKSQKDKENEAKDGKGEEDKTEEVPDNFDCKLCNFVGENKEAYEEHVGTASHKRRVFIETQEMPSGGVEAFSSDGGRCNTIEEMCLIREGKDINEQVAKSKTLRDSDDIKKAKESLVNKLFDHGVFTQLAVKTNVRCNTCRCQLSGKEKMLTHQLIMHLTGEKHTSKLRLQIKAEEHTGVDRNTAQEMEDREAEEAGEGEEEEGGAAPPAAAAVPSLDAPVEDIAAWLADQSSVFSITPELFCCEECKTGLKLAKDLLVHLTSEAHKAGITEQRDWRRYIEWCDMYEHGEDIFKASIVLLTVVEPSSCFLILSWSDKFFR